MDTVSSILELSSSTPLKQVANDLFTEEVEHYALTKNEVFRDGKLKTRVFGNITEAEYTWLNKHLKKNGYPEPQKLWGVPAEQFTSTSTLGSGRMAEVREMRMVKVYDFINYFWNYRSKPHQHPLN